MTLLSRGFVLLLLAAAAHQGVRAQNVEAVRMRVQILPADGSSPEESDALVAALREALRERAAGEEDPLESYSLVSNLQLDTMAVSTEEVDSAIDIVSDTGVRAMAGTDFQIRAGGGLKARIQETADVAAGGVELQSLNSVNILSGDDAELSVSGDIGATASGAARLNAVSLSSTVAGSTGVVAGGGLDVAAGGAATVESESLTASVSGDVEVSGGRLAVSGSQSLSVTAGDVAVQSPGAVRVQSGGAYAQLSGDTRTDFVTYVWRSSTNFGTFENVLPEAVLGVKAIVIEAMDGSTAQVVGTSGITAVGMSLGEHGGAGSVAWHGVWSSTYSVGTYSLDGMEIELDRLYDVSAVRLESSPSGGHAFSGWSAVKILLGVEVSGPLEVASASDLEVTSGQKASLTAEMVQMGSSSSIDVSSGSAAHLSSEDVMVLASGALSASAGFVSVEALDTLQAFAGGAVSASAGSASAEVRGDASLAAAGAASLSGESATMAVSGDVAAAADALTLNIDSVDVTTTNVEGTAAESASLLTSDATISASGTLSAFANEMETLLEGDFTMQSKGDATVRTDTFNIDTLDEASLVTKRMLDTKTERLRVRAGVQQNAGKVRVALDCEEMPELCASVRSGNEAEETFAAQAAELLGVSPQRLAVRSQPSPVEQTGRRRTESQQAPVDTTGRRRRLETTSDSSATDGGGEGEGGSGARRRPRSHTRLRELSKWSVREVEKWLRNVQKVPGVAQGVARERVDGPMAIELAAVDWQELGATPRQGAKLADAVRDVVERGGLPKREMG
jgi:hypothetical protein